MIDLNMVDKISEKILAAGGNLGAAGKHIHDAWALADSGDQALTDDLVEGIKGAEEMAKALTSAHRRLMLIVQEVKREHEKGKP